MQVFLFFFQCDKLNAFYRHVNSSYKRTHHGLKWKAALFGLSSKDWSNNEEKINKIKFTRSKVVQDKNENKKDTQKGVLKMFPDSGWASPCKSPFTL